MEITPKTVVTPISARKRATRSPTGSSASAGARMDTGRVAVMALLPVATRSTALDLRERMLRRIGGRDRLGRSDHDHHDRILLADIGLAAVDARRHGNAVAF